MALRTCFLEELLRAVELYTGELLPDDAYEDWTLARRRTLAALYEELLAALAREYALVDRPWAAIETLERLIAIDPGSEHAHTELMRLRAGAGDRRGALLEYSELRRELASELGVEPSEATERVRHAILEDSLPPRPRQRAGGS
jgi:DNA-binding SARP family transcriptional activator